MANIVPLEIPDNVTLIGGASQYWSDRPRTLNHIDWTQILVPQMAGRVLVVGWCPDETLAQLAAKADELHVLVRGIVGASQAAKIAPHARIWCGDPKNLATHTEPFDTILCVADVCRVLPLESEQRTWREVVNDVLSLARPDATVMLWVENDLGAHRITANHNPRGECSDDAWNPMATFDDSRPLTLEAVRQEFKEADVRVTWPSSQWSLVVDPEAADEPTHVALAERAALAPINGPDPAYILTTAARADHFKNYVSGWLVVLNARADLGPSIQFTDSSGVKTLNHVMPDGARSASSVFAELSASQDMPAIRRFIADWSATYADSAAGSPSFPLNTVRRVEDRFEFTALAEARPGAADQLRWAALGELVAIMRARSWRHLWPANYSDTRILNHLGIMAGLHTVSSRRAAALIPPAPESSEGFASLDMQSLAAAIDRNNETIRALRSQVNLLKLDLAKARSLRPFWRVRRIMAMIKRQLANLIKF